MKDAIADTAETKHEMSAAFQKFGKNRNRVKIATESETMQTSLSLMSSKIGSHC